jgi:hypothetical protein
MPKSAFLSAPRTAHLLYVVLASHVPSTRDVNSIRCRIRCLLSYIEQDERIEDLLLKLDII